MSNQQLFALYKGDELIDVGTARELAERQGVKPSTIGFMASPAYHKRAKGDRILAYRLED